MNVDSLIETLVESKGAHINRVTALGNGRSVMTFNLDGELVQALVKIEEFVGKLPRAAKQTYDLGNLIKAGRSAKSSWAISELKAEGLPLYWNKEWLEKALDECGSYSEIERIYGYPSYAVNRYAIEHHSIDMRKKSRERKERIQEDWLNCNDTLQTIADRHGVSAATVHSFVKGLEREPKVKVKGEKKLTKYETKIKKRKERIQEDWLTCNDTLQTIADRHGVSIGTVHAHTRGLERGSKLKKGK